jgi:predicted regulator of amino acid metabolism with ACT domain
MNKILTQHGEMQKIADLFKVDRRTVFNALTGVYDSDTVRRIRKMAIDRGGMEMNNSLKIKINESTN